jgi:hypothetical protein
MTYRKAGAISFAVDNARGHLATSGSPPRDEEIRAAGRMALCEADPIGKAQAPHVERRGYRNELRSGLL